MLAVVLSTPACSPSGPPMAVRTPLDPLRNRTHRTSTPAHVVDLGSLGLQGFARDQLPSEQSGRVFEDLHLDSLAHPGGTALGRHGEDVALDMEVDLRRVHSREVEEDGRRVAVRDASIGGAVDRDGPPWPASAAAC